MENTALLVVDIQTGLINLHPYKEAEFLANIINLIQTSRQNGIEVIYIRHDGGSETPLAYGQEGWQIFSKAAPINEDVIAKMK